MPNKSPSALTLILRSGVSISFGANCSSQCGQLVLGQCDRNYYTGVSAAHFDPIHSGKALATVPIEEPIVPTVLRSSGAIANSSNKSVNIKAVAISALGLP